MSTLMTAAYLLTAALSASGFYLATTHQQVWQRSALPARWLRIGGAAWLALSLACAIALLGVWAGVFAVVSALMLAAVALPSLDAWWQARAQRRQVRHVG